MTDGPLYDPELRRETPLALKLKERIRREGPITVAQYMEACLQDPDHGYYRTKAAIGAQGDFVTAPEISQVFGELIGLWCAVVWQQMGSPSKVNLVELGPGRGTLMRDALRAAKVLPAFLAAAEVHLVESNEALRRQQAEALAGWRDRLTWHTVLDALPLGRPTIVIANEFLDTFPVEQFTLTQQIARRRGVGVDAKERLCFVNVDEPFVSTRDIDDGIVEEANYRPLWQLNHMLSSAQLAALLIDYGHISALSGDTLQAVKCHRAEHPLTSPGEADLTVQVDFASAAAHLAQPPQGLPAPVIDGPVTQAEFLGALGILPRTARLMAANPTKAHEIEVGTARLMAVPGMGDRFKVLGVRSALLTQLPGFPSSD